MSLKAQPAGLLIVDKPIGMGSTDVVRMARKALGMRKVGHAGTLDPDASGVLLVCVGEGTKAVPFLMDGEKCYETTATLGTETSTDDAAGELYRSAPWEHVTEESLNAAIAEFHGTFSQLPPRVSAIKKDGRRMYERVRAGEDVEALLTPREVELRALSLTEIDLPRFSLEMTVGKGFYVRSLVRDIGRALGSAAHVQSLRRTRVGPFTTEQAISPEEIKAGALLSVADALAHLPTVVAGQRDAARIRNGQRPPIASLEHSETVEEETPLRVMGPGGLLAIGKVIAGELRVVRGFVHRPSKTD